MADGAGEPLAVLVDDGKYAAGNPTSGDGLFERDKCTLETLGDVVGGHVRFPQASARTL